jgi:DNA-binding MarR family transcriptional regulator
VSDDPVVSRLRVATMRLAQRMRQESGNDADLTPSRFAALSYVVANKTVRMGDLARAEHVGKSTITRIVSRLAEQGLVEMVPDPNDGRSTLVAATPAGIQVSVATSAQIDTFLADRLGAFTELETAALQVAVLAMERLARVEK